METSADQWILWQGYGLTLNATIVFTWLIMALLALGARRITAHMSSDDVPSRWQNLLEVIVVSIQNQIGAVGVREPHRYLPFIGTVFVFIATANMLVIFPGYVPPTASLSTTTALALCVLVAVPAYSISEQGLVEFLKNYIRPTPFMLPFNILGELSRTIALAVRLYGNVMSGTIIVGILISIAPFFFPVLLQLLGLLTGFIQAYIFAMLAMVYIASATQIQPAPTRAQSNPPKHDFNRSHNGE